MIKDGVGEAFEDILEATLELNVRGVPLNIGYADYLLGAGALMKTTLDSSKERWHNYLVVVDAKGKKTETEDGGCRLECFEDARQVLFGLITPNGMGEISLYFNREHPSQLVYTARITNGGLGDLVGLISNPGSFYRLVDGRIRNVFYSFAGASKRLEDSNADNEHS